MRGMGLHSVCMLLIINIHGFETAFVWVSLPLYQISSLSLSLSFPTFYLPISHTHPLSSSFSSSLLSPPFSVCLSVCLSLSLSGSLYLSPSAPISFSFLLTPTSSLLHLSNFIRLLCLIPLTCLRPIKLG